MKELEEMDLFELAQLKDVVKGIVETYDNILTTYGILNGDKFLQNMPPSTKLLFDKKNLYSRYILKINEKIEEKLVPYVEKN